ncbi:MAG: hypothetical protein H7145_09975 [Akkermansiaceae bacterium]|nr:hypothetical protein [Armatimonadota bacterium]
MFDSDTASDTEYMGFVAWLSDRAASEICEARGDMDQQKTALCRYFKRGLRANMTTNELIDFLGVSTPSVLERAELTEEESDTVMAISDRLTETEIELLG